MQLARFSVWDGKTIHEKIIVSSEKLVLAPFLVFCHNSFIVDCNVKRIITDLLFPGKFQDYWDIMAGIPGCVLVALSVIRCVFNPLHYPQDITTVSTSKIEIITQNAALNELSYDSISWPLLKKVQWNGNIYLCESSLGQCLKENLLTGRPEYSPTTEIPPPTVAEQMIIIHATSSFLKKTFVQQSIDVTKVKTVATPRITHPHRPSPPVKISPLKPVVSTIETTMIEIKQEYLTTISYHEGTNKSFKELFKSFKKDIEELIMGACGTVFSAGTVLFILKTVYKHRKKCFCYQNELAAEIMEGGLQLLNNTVLDASVQTETTLILTDEDEEMDENSVNDGESEEGQELEKEGAVGGETDVKTAAGGQGEMHPTTAAVPSAPLLTPIHCSSPIKVSQKKLNPTRKSLRVHKEKTCGACT